MTFAADTPPSLGFAERTAPERGTVPELLGSDRVRLSPKYEVLQLASGDVFLDNIYGAHFRLSNVSNGARRLLSRLAAGDIELRALRSEHPSPPEGRLLDRLVGAGVVVRDAEGTAPRWATASFRERFRPQLDWLSDFDAAGDPWVFMERLQRAHVLLIGAGGVGSNLAMALAAAGVGRLTLVDGDQVEPSNLTRQIHYSASDAANGVRKVDALARAVGLFTEYTEVTTVPTFVRSADHARELVRAVDVVVLCADAPRFVLNRWVNDACVDSGTASLSTFVGQVGPFFIPGVSPCFNCFEEAGRAEMGSDLYEDVVRALGEAEHWRYPAFVSGPASISAVMTMELTLFLTGARAPESSGASIRLAYPEMQRTPATLWPGCRCHAPG